MKYKEIPLVYHESNHTFELIIDGLRPFIESKQQGDTFYLVHTEVPAELEGKGVTAAMVEKTLRYLEENNFKLVPSCSYVQTYLKRHPQWNKLL